MAKELTESAKQAMLAELARSHVDGDQPDPRAWGAGNGEADPVSRIPYPAIPADDPDAAGWEDLSGAELDRCEPFPLPGGKRLFVFPMSGRQKRSMALWTRRLAAELREEDSTEERDAKLAAMLVEVQAMQVALCCRRGPTRKHRASYRRGDCPAILNNLAAEAIAEICEVSDGLGKTGAVTAKELAPFFIPAGVCFESWLSASAGWADCPPGLREMTTQLLSAWPRATSPATGK